MRPQLRHLALPALALAVFVSPRTVRSQSLLDFWVPNGRVNATAYDPDRERLYIGGQFDRVGAPSGAGALVDGTSGAVLTPLLRIAPIGAVVRTVASDGAGGWFFGGEFTQVQGVARQNLAHVDAAGALTSWNPGADGPVFTLALSGGVLYAGGGFATLGGTSRTRLGALDPSTGALTAWAPTANDTVRFLGIFSGVIYIGGDFTQINATTRNRTAALNTSGALTTWNPNANDAVLAIYRSGTNIALGGDFTQVGATSQPHVAVVNTTTGAPAPSVIAADGAVYALEADATRLFVGGAFTTIGGASRTGLAAFNLATLAIDASWNANLDGAVRDLQLLGAQLYAVGDFENAGGGRRAGSARMSAATATFGVWDPRTGAPTHCVGATATNAFVGGRFLVVNYENSTAGFHKNLAAYDFSPGSPTFGRPLSVSLNASFANGSPSSVQALELDGADLYIGGSFNRFNGTARSCAAKTRVDLWATQPWDPNPNSSVISIDVVANGTAALGGYFTSPGQNVALVNTSFGGSLGPIATPFPASTLLQVAFAPGGFDLFYAGAFDFVGSEPLRRFARLGLPYQSSNGPNPFPVDSISNSNMLLTRALATSNSQFFYVGGTFDHYGSLDRRNLLEIDLTSGMPTSWAPNPGAGGIWSLGVAGDRLYVGGQFSTIQSQPRVSLASFDVANHTLLTSWNPSLYGLGATPFSISGASNRVAVGGVFEGANGTFSPYFAVFDDNSPPPVGVGPRLDLPAPRLGVIPNPAIERASIAFTLPRASIVSLEILDLQGRIVREVLAGANLGPGAHRAPFDVSGLRAGVFVVRLRDGARTTTARWAHVR